MNPGGPTTDLRTVIEPLAQLVPPEYAQYRPVLIEALAYFASNLPAPRQTRLIEVQLRMPYDATVEQRLVALMHACPTLHKLGQVVARQKHLSPALRHELKCLETLEPCTPVDELQAIIDRELPERNRIGIELDDSALAEGSVASIIGFTLRDPANALPRRGVLKVLKAGVADALHDELTIWADVGAFLDESTERYGLPALDYRNTFEAVRNLLANEVEFHQEQANLVEAQASFDTTPGVVIPRLFPFCTPALTAMERIDGVPLTNLGSSGREDRSNVSCRIVEALLARPVFDNATHALFHADPHAGNLMLTRDDKLALIDWSLVGRLSKRAREAIVQILLGGWTRDRARVASVVEDLSINGASHSRVLDAVDNALAGVTGGVVPGLSWLTHTLDELAIHAGVRFEPDLLMFRKALLTIQGLLNDVDPSFPIDAALIRLAVTQLAAEAPARVWSDPFTRRFRSHLSNMDLWAASASAPSLIASSMLTSLFAIPARP